LKTPCGQTFEFPPLPPPPPHEQSATEARRPKSFTSALDLYGHATWIFANSMPDSLEESGSIPVFSAFSK
jgi:hypothetical protein